MCCNACKTKISARSKHRRISALTRSHASTAATPPRLLQRCLGTLDRIQHRRRLAALHLAGPHPARHQTRQPARPARLLQFRRRRTDHRWHLASGVQRGASGPDRASRNPARRTQCLCPVPSTGTSRRQRLDGRLLLPQQRRHRCSSVPRSGPGARSRDPRRRLPPRQWHPIDFL